MIVDPDLKRALNALNRIFKRWRKRPVGKSLRSWL